MDHPYDQSGEAMINYHNKRFRVAQNSDNGEVSDELIFHYTQEGNILRCSYSGGKIRAGHLIGLVDETGRIDMRYHQVNEAGILMTGHCQSTPEILPDGRIRLYEKWRWTSGDCSEGTSILEEIG